MAKLIFILGAALLFIGIWVWTVTNVVRWFCGESTLPTKILVSMIIAWFGFAVIVWGIN